MQIAAKLNRQGKLPSKKSFITHEITPASFSGLFLWLDAQDPSNNREVPTNGTAIAIWSDKSGNGWNATQGTASLQPKIFYDATNGFNGKPILKFDAVNDYLETASLTLNQPRTDFVVAVRDSGFTAGQRLIYNNPTNGELFFNGSNTVTSNSGALLSATQADGSFHVITAVQNGSSSSVRVDNGTPVTGNNGTSNISNQTISIGGSSGGFTLRGRIAEVITYNVALTTQQITDISRYLGLKWGIPVS
jgi:hypothetical protein